jgi:hypothetical protein
MSFAYPQFGNPDYSGFTTEEEFARRAFMPSARQSPVIGAQMQIDEPIAPVYAASPTVAPVIATTTTPVDAPTKSASTSDAVAQIFRSKPVSAFDWILLYIIIVAAICFIEYARDFLRGYSHVGGSNFCSACGGTVSAHP